MGSFGCHIKSLQLLRSNGERPACSSIENPELFAATIGGLGLTGLIISAEVQLIKIAGPCLTTENLPFDSLEEFTQISESSADWQYTVAWVDASANKAPIGRGVFTRAKHCSGNQDAEGKKRNWRPSIPITPPFSCVNKTSVSLFNKAYYYRNSRKLGLRTHHYQPFFFPLDSIGHWDRIYGRSGFFQYQCVFPEKVWKDALRELLARIQSSGQGSFLTVLKAFGDKQSPGLLSFPRPGMTLAIDFPNRGEKTKRLLRYFDEIVLSTGGALYPAKDARMSANLFRQGFPQLETFTKQIDPHFSSAFWRRVQNAVEGQNLS